MEALLSKNMNKLRLFSNLFLVSLIFLTPLPNLGTDVYTPSLPAIVTSLNTSANLVKLTVVIYLITYGVGQLIFGVLSDILGRRPLLLLGLASFIMASVIASYSNNINLLLAVRFFQGLSVSIISVLTKSIITDKYRGKNLKKTSNYKVAAQVLSLILAPLIGGYIQLVLNWRWAFLLLAIYGGLGFFITYAFIPETCKIKNKFNVKNIWLNMHQVFSHSGFMIMTLNTAILYAIVGVFGILGSFIVQETLHYNSSAYGIAALCCGIFYMLGSKLSHKISTKALILMYSAFSTISPLILIFFGLTGLKSLVLFISPICVIMVGCGLLLPRIMSYTLGLFRSQAGTSSAIFGALVMLGMGFVLSLTGFIHANNIVSLGEFYLVLGFSSMLLMLFREAYKHL